MIQTIVGALSAFAALAAVIVAVCSERRNQRRFDEQLRESRELAQANVKPLLAVSSQTYADLKSVRLTNRGIGSAIITKVEFSRGQQRTTDLVDLFQINERPFLWETFRRLPNRYFVAPSDTIYLVKLSAPHLRQQGLSEQEAGSILAQWQQQKSGIHVLLEYEDVLGNPQPACDETLN